MYVFLEKYHIFLGPNFLKYEMKIMTVTTCGGLFFFKVFIYLFGGVRGRGRESSSRATHPPTECGAQCGAPSHDSEIMT